jgi:large subunit ribosomal protein L17
MRHGNKKVRFADGQDANQMLERKLLKNFFTHGKITTTETKVKFIKGRIDTVISLAKKNTQSARNSMLRMLGDDKLVSQLVEKVPAAVGERVSGFTKSARLFERDSDATFMMRLEWVTPLVLSDVKVEEPKKPSKAEGKTEVTKSGAKVTVRKARKAKSA